MKIPLPKRLIFLVVILSLSVHVIAQVIQPKRLPDGTLLYPDGIKRLPNGVVKYPDGSKVPVGTTMPDGSIVYPNGKTYPPYPVYPKSSTNGHAYPPKGKQQPDGSIVYSSGKITYPDGSVRYPDGHIKFQDGTLRYPNGTIKNSNQKNTKWPPSGDLDKQDSSQHGPEVINGHGNGRDYPAGANKNGNTGHKTIKH